ncbi:MAG: M20 family peptidase [Enterobacterales bacterium]|nr:M20 family peptidase [Enterobacterales bacterium]
MRSIFKLLKLLIILLVLLSSVLLYRTFQFQQDKVNYDKINLISMDYEAAVKRFAQSLQIKTISYQNPEDRDPNAIIEFHQFLLQSFPRLHQQLELTKINQYSLLYHWKGESDLNQHQTKPKPILLMAHFDVVPINPSTLDQWQYPPFDGVVAEQTIWGRGALDDKSAVVSLMEAVEQLISSGFKPNRDIYISLGHDEEVGGLEGAAKTAEYLKSKAVEFEFVLDEGGFLTQDIIKGVKLPIGVIGVAEKGYLSLKLTTQSAGGHSSVPPDITSIGRLSRALVAIEEHPFKPRLVAATRGLLQTLGLQMPFAKRLVMANLWLFEPFVLQQMSHSPLTNASIRTTQALTVFNAGSKENVLPTEASAIVNLRLLPGDNLKQVLSQVVTTINDPLVKVESLRGIEATSISDFESYNFELLSKTLQQVSPEADILIAPNLLSGGTDSKHFISLSENVYRLNGVKVDKTSFSGFHGINEHLAIDEYKRSINFYYQLIRHLND